MTTSIQYRILWAPVALWLMVSIASCGGLAGPTLSAEAVHQGYLDALQHHDRAKLLAFSGDETYMIENADRRLEKMRHAQNSGNHRTGGNLSRVDLVSLTDEGVGKRGVSRWVYAKRAVCHDAVLAQTDQGWRVTAWYELPHCPTH